MSNQFYILVDRKPVPVNDSPEWSRWFNVQANRTVEQTDLPLARVSTIFLGIDHNFFNDGPPLLFETMIFWTNPEGRDYQTRSSTWEEAERHHHAACDMVLDAQNAYAKLRSQLAGK